MILTMRWVINISTSCLPMAGSYQFCVRLDEKLDAAKRRKVGKGITYQENAELLEKNLLFRDLWLPPPVIKALVSSNALRKSCVGIGGLSGHGSGESWKGQGMEQV